MQQMRSRVIPHSRLPNVSVHNGVNLIPDLEGAPPYAVFVGWGLHDHLMRPHTMNGVVTSLHFGDHGVVIVRVKPSAISNLSASLSIKRRVIQNNLARFPCLELPRSLPVVNDG